jgi:hypothetical protein
MRKRLLDPLERTSSVSSSAWLDLDRHAAVEVTSEQSAHPIEAALVPGSEQAAGGWRAAEPGPQVVRVRFDEPQRLRHIRLQIDEPAAERTQELALRWSADGGASFREVVRQQWTFSPHGATREVEDYQVDLAGVTVLELDITPNIGGGPAVASLTEMRLSS